MHMMNGLDKEVSYGHMMRLKGQLPKSKTLIVKAEGYSVWWGKKVKK